MSKPIALVTGDLHFTLGTMELASSVLFQMEEKSVELNVPIILNGDTLDTKAIVRGEVMNLLVKIVSNSKCKYIVNTGNHDLLSEKSNESSLTFLKPYAVVVDTPKFFNDLNLWIIPYQSTNESMVGVLSSIPKKSMILVHQGVNTAFMGHYVQDSSSLPKEYFSDFRIIASHYHRRQDIKCGRPRKGGIGLFSYLGNPYSLTFGEAEDGPKGFNILMSDGSLEFVPTNLRKHVILTETIGKYQDLPKVNKDDLLWLKVTGPKSELDKLDKAAIGKWIIGHSNYKLDLIPTEEFQNEQPLSFLASDVILDTLIDRTSETPEYKDYLKSTWRDLLK